MISALMSGMAGVGGWAGAEGERRKVLLIENNLERVGVVEVGKMGGGEIRMDVGCWGVNATRGGSSNRRLERVFEGGM